MGANNPAKQHYIPRFLLKQFLDESGRLWVHDKDRRKTYSTSPRKAFVQRDLYTTFGFAHIPKDTDPEAFLQSMTKDYTYETERFGTNLEGNVAPIVSRIIQKARSGQLPRLTEREAAYWKRFMLAIARRTPESQRRATSISGDDAFYEALKARAEAENYKLPDQESLYRDPRIRKLMERVLANVNAKFAAGDSPREKLEEDRFCRETGLCVAVIRDPGARNGFLIGSHGLAILQGGPLGDSIDGSWLPIAHDVAVLATSAPDKEFLLDLGSARRRVVEAINAASYTQSRIVAGRSEELVRSLATRPIPL